MARRENGSQGDVMFPIVLLTLLVSFILALGFGTYAHIAKTKWRDIEKTQKYAFLAIIFTIIFMIVGIMTLPG